MFDLAYNKPASRRAEAFGAGAAALRWSVLARRHLLLRRPRHAYFMKPLSLVPVYCYELDCME